MSKQQTRQANCLAIILKNHGIESAEIRRRMFAISGMHDRGLISHALTQLFKRGEVTRERVKTGTCRTYKYFVKDTQAPNTIPVTNMKKILSLIEVNPGLSVTSLRSKMSEAGVSPSAQCANLLDLFRQKKVIRKKMRTEGRLQFHYFIADNGRPNETKEEIVCSRIEPNYAEVLAEHRQSESESKSYHDGVTVCRMLCEIAIIQSRGDTNRQKAFRDMMEMIRKVA